MAKQINLERGGFVTRAWDGEGFRFEIGDVSVMISIRPTRVELLKIASMFRQAAFKMPKPEGREHIPDSYEAPTVALIGELDDEERKDFAETVEDEADGRDDE